MRFKTLIAGLGGMLMATALAAQTPVEGGSAPAAGADAPSAAAEAPATPAIVMPPLEPENTLNLDLSTGGRVVVQLRPDLAPNHVERIKTLARGGFYNGLTFHRVIEGFMAQGGDPKGDGTGGSDLPDINAEFNALPHVRGVVSAARTADANSANSQFFIMLRPRLSLDGKYTGFGRVVDGMQYVDAMERGEPPLNPARILQASIGSDNVPPPPPGYEPPVVELAPADAPAASMAPAEPETNPQN